MQYSSLLAYDEYYNRTYRKQKLLVNKTNGATLEWKGEDDKLREYLASFPEVTVIEQDIPTVNLGILLDGNTMYDGPNPMGIDNYPLVPVFGYYTPELPYSEWRIQGMVRALRGPQFLFNRRLIIQLDILESQKTSGIMAKENSLVNPKDAYKTGQGTVLWLKEDAQMTDIQTIQPPNLTAGILQITDTMQRLINDISGINEELLGSAVDDKAGILAMLRQGAGLTTLQSLFDQLDRSQKLLGKRQLEAIQNNWTPGKIEQIIEEKPTEQFYNKNFGKYDAAIEEGTNTTTQRQMQFAQLMYLREAGVNVPSEFLLKAATLQNKNDLIAAVSAQEQAAQQQQQMTTQAALQEQQATMQLAQARAAADIGLGMERQSRIQENQQLARERHSQIQKNEMDALYTFAKAYTEFKKTDVTADKDEILMKMFKALKDIESIDINSAPMPQNTPAQMQQMPMQQPQQGGDINQLLSQLQ